MKQGDKVKCIDASDGLSKGMVYEVMDATNILVLVSNDHGDVRAYSTDRFKMVSGKFNLNNFILIFNIIAIIIIAILIFLIGLESDARTLDRLD